MDVNRDLKIYKLQNTKNTDYIHREKFDYNQNVIIIMISV